jgi:PleD family two-component response regulator
MRTLFASRIEMVRMLLRSATSHPEALRAVAAKLDESAQRVEAPPASTSTVTAPLHAAAVATPSTRVIPDGTPPVIEPRPWIGPASEHRPRILAVDDSVSSLHVLKIQLGRAGIDVIPASTPDEAFAQLAKADPEAIILDVVMPEMTGFEMCRLIREREASRNTPILFLSAACSLEERIRGLEVGGDDFIRKPCDAQELALRVRSHLARVAVLGDRGRA